MTTDPDPVDLLAVEPAGEAAVPRAAEDERRAEDRKALASGPDQPAEP
jgi:hypothetical protein